MPSRSLIAPLVAATALLLAPTAARAADTYVNSDGAGASDAGDCTVMTTPCQTIGAGLAKAGAGDTVHVDDGPPLGYLEALVLTDGKSLIADNFDNSLTGFFRILGDGGPAITVPAGETGGTVRGFVLFAPVTGPLTGELTVLLEGPATLRGNILQNSVAGATALDISTPAGGTGTVIDGNTFEGGGISANTAISVSEGAPQITNNAISTAGNGFNTGVQVQNGSNPTIDGNTFAAIFDATPDGAAIRVSDSTATITDNRMIQPGTGTVNGVILGENSSPTGATLRRNRLFGNGTGDGFQASGTTSPVTLESNLIAGFAQGVYSEGSGGAATDGDISIVNGTLADNGQDLTLLNTHVNLDSSIVQDPISVSGAGDPGCTISFSRGPSTLPGTCTQFQITADPGFVSGGLPVEFNDYHLMPTSAMIDAGNPAAPSAGSLDIDGEARALDADGACPLTPRRDIGADEFEPAALDCVAPNTIKGKSRIRKRARRARFTFRSSEPGAHFQCKLDRKPFKPCTSPKRYRGLKPGRHRFQVRAIDAAGNVDATPAVKKFRIPPRRS